MLRWSLMHKVQNNVERKELEVVSLSSQMGEEGGLGHV